jgi:hypothetical protein
MRAIETEITGRGAHLARLKKRALRVRTVARAFFFLSIIGLVALAWRIWVSPPLLR